MIIPCFLSYVTRSREMSHMSKIFNFETLTPPSGNLKMLHFSANPIIIGYLVTDLWANYQCWKQYKIKEFELFLCQYLKNSISDIRLILLNHVTYHTEDTIFIFHFCKLKICKNVCEKCKTISTFTSNHWKPNQEGWVGRLCEYKARVPFLRTINTDLDKSSVCLNSSPHISYFHAIPSPVFIDFLIIG